MIRVTESQELSGDGQVVPEAGNDENLSKSGVVWFPESAEPEAIPPPLRYVFCYSRRIPASGTFF